MEIIYFIVAIAIIALSVFLIIIFPSAAWRISQDLPKIVNRLNTIIEILNQKGVMK